MTPEIKVARKFIRDFLRTHPTGVHPDDVCAAAAKAGITWGTIHRAKRHMPIVYMRERKFSGKIIRWLYPPRRTNKGQLRRERGLICPVCLTQWVEELEKKVGGRCNDYSLGQQNGGCFGRLMTLVDFEKAEWFTPYVRDDETPMRRGELI